MIRRTVIILLGVQLLLTLVVLIRDVAGQSDLPLLTILTSLVTFAFVLLHGSANLGWKKLGLLAVLTLVISLTMESIGVATGLIYGPYSYTTRLGPKFLDLVPLVIPLIWFNMLYPSFVMAKILTPPLKSRWRSGFLLASFTALAITSWDLVIDPLLVASGHWTWHVDGAYFGIPLQNYIGWFITAWLILIVYLLITHWRSRESTSEYANFNRLAILSYTFTGLSTVFLAFHNDLGGPALAALMAMLPWILLSWFHR